MGFESSGHRQWKVNAPGGAAPFEAGASQRWDGDRDLGLPPISMTDNFRPCEKYRLSFSQSPAMLLMFTAWGRTAWQARVRFYEV